MRSLSQLLGKSNLDFSEEEVREVSKIFVNFYKDNLFDNKIKRKLVVYVGEMFKSHFGGEWNFTSLKSDSWALNEPVVTKFKDEGIRMSPSEWIFSMFEREDINHFNKNIDYIIDSQRKREELFAQIFPKKEKK